MAMLDMEIHEHRSLSLAAGLRPAVRLNGSSDLCWELWSPELFSRHPDCEFYCYTKLVGRCKNFAARNAPSSQWPKNYHLTFSLSETNGRWFDWMLEHGVNVAVVFEGDIPSRYLGHRTIDGDKCDARFLDESPRVVGLSAKGVARHDLTGFVVREGRTPKHPNSSLFVL